MKKFSVKSLLYMVLLSSISCKKNFETKPSDFLTAENYFITEEQVDSYLASVYDPLNTNTPWYRQEFRTNLAEGTDESYNTSNVANPYPGHYSAGAGDANIAAFWRSIYQGIERANILLENLDKAPLSEARQKTVRGETRFLRAYYLFTATQWFGDIPLKTTSSKTPGDGQIAFTHSKEVYDWVIKEMTEAEALLVDQKASSLTHNERVTYTAVQGMLSRVCLFAAGYPVNDTKRYAEALSWTNKVKASAEHKLIPDYRQVFINHSADLYDNVNRECIWEVGMYTNAANTALRELLGTFIGVSNINNTWGEVEARTRTTAVLYRAYQSIYDPTNRNDNSPDLRRDWNVAPYTLTGGDDNIPPTVVPVAWNSWWLRYPGKWRRQFEVVVPRDQNNSPQNFPLLRYADVLLMLAEAENEVNGPTTIAYEAINQVRRRSYGSGSRVTAITVTNGGSGYTSAPRVTVAPSLIVPVTGMTDGTLAASTVSGGRVTAINVTSSVGFYNSVPAVTIIASGGTGATATATIVAINPVAADLRPGLSKDEFRKAIQDERLRELNGECLRRQDLKRWNLLVGTVKMRSDIAVNGSADRFTDGTQKIRPITATNVTASIDGANITERYIYLPIPLAELTNNKLAKQNPGF